MKRKLVIGTLVLILAALIGSGGFTVYRLLSSNVQDAASMESAEVLKSAEDVSQNQVQSEEAEVKAQEAPLEDSEKVEIDGAKKDNKFEIIKYEVVAGDTLESIAKAHKVKVSTITESNGISEKGILSIGKKLEFPSVDGALYKIKKGDTLSELASTYDISSEYTMDLNEITSPEKIQIGQQILLPGVERIQKEAPKVKETVKVASRGSTPNKTSSSSSASSSKSSSSSGGMWPLKGTVTSGYGSRWGTQHKGIDIAASTGTNVYAFMDGKVTYSRWNSGGYGYLIKIDHGNGLETYYAHNSKLLVKEGSYVKKGQHISEVGSTGYSTGPHLHFEIRKNGTPVNPYNYF